jgi:hypothetical protein
MDIRTYYIGKEEKRKEEYDILMYMATFSNTLFTALFDPLLDSILNGTFTASA